MTSREVARSARRLAARQKDRLQELPGEVQLATVVSIGAGGNVTVNWRGGDVITAGKSANYTPAIGDWVMCLLHQSRLFVICAINGQP